jgi:hypothetical protein
MVPDDSPFVPDSWRCRLDGSQELILGRTEAKSLREENGPEDGRCVAVGLD